MQLDRPLAVVTPTIDGDVLTALARVDAKLTAADVTRILGRFSEPGIRKVLVRLVAQGIVEVELVGRTSAYRLNREHLAADAVMAMVSARDRLVERLRSRFGTWPSGVAYAAVFGSSARGDMRPDSDIDLLVVHDDDVSRLEMDERIVDLMIIVPRWTGNRVDLVLISVSDLRGGLDEPLYHDVRRDGLTVAGSQDWFEAQFQSKGDDRAYTDRTVSSSELALARRAAVALVEAARAVRA